MSDAGTGRRSTTTALVVLVGGPETAITVSLVPEVVASCSGCGFLPETMSGGRVEITGFGTAATLGAARGTNNS